MAFDGFTDAGRNFYVFAAVGTRVLAPTRRELQRVVDSLRFEPRRRRRRIAPMSGLSSDGRAARGG